MSELFENVSIGTMELRNRFVRSATWEGMAAEDGGVTDGLVEIYRDLAKGGVGLILTGFAFVNKRGKCNAGMLGADDDALIPGLKKIADVVHAEGGKVALQIAHGGAQSRFETGFPLEAPSAVKERAFGTEPEEMTVDDIRRTVTDFAEAARRAKEAGFDGVEMHAAHGYLLSEFLSPYTNRREDEYGGPIETRARIVVEVYEAIREKVGTDWPVMVKINSADFVAPGLTAAESVIVCKKLSDIGIDAIELSGGTPASGERMPAREGIDGPEKEAYFRVCAKEFRPEITCPLILVGGVRSIEVAEAIYEEGTADFFSLARPLISEPDLINRWAGGDRRRARCISCNKCLMAAVKEGRLYCVTYSGKEGA
ncbi:MAG: NADH:flavin oxidoreductase [Thermodesulfobacteriota bacterium]